jgi:hypothetical protein
MKGWKNMERPTSYYAKPAIDNDQAGPDALAMLSGSKEPVTIMQLALAHTHDSPIDRLALWMWEGPINEKFQCGIVVVENFTSEENRAMYLRSLYRRFVPGTEVTVEDLQKLHSILLAKAIVTIVRDRLIDANFRNDNRNCGYGFVTALEHLKSGNPVAQQKALLCLLKAFGEEFLADQSFPIIGERYLHHTRANRGFAREAHAALATKFRKTRTRHDARRDLIFLLTLRPELVRAYFDGPVSAHTLMTTLERAGNVWTDLTPKSFGELLGRTFKDLKA